MKDRKKAFSLLEMMVVIIIISILMVGFLLSPILQAIRVAKEKRAQTERDTIKLAIRNYRYEYGRWPCFDGDDTTSTMVFALSPPNGDVVNYLINKATNPKEIRFLNTTQYTMDSTNNLINPVTFRPYTITISAPNDAVSVN